MAAAHVQDFINELWPHAVAIGDANGIDPITIVTQAAIETGWGKEVAGNNYFGIKSHGKSGGQVITTHEEIDGKRVKSQDSFRVYGSLAESVEDYARFLHENPRYAGALKETGFEKQLAGITSAGYATDSKYLKLVNGVSKMVSRAAPLTPPGSIPNTVGTQLDVVPPTPKVAPTPEPRIIASAARTNRMFDRPIPAPRGDATVARTNGMLTRAQAVRDTPLPRARPVGIEPAQIQNAPPAAPRAVLPPIGPTGGPPLTRTQPVTPNSTAGSVQMAPGMRPAAADTLVQQAENAQRRNTLAASQSYAGQDAAAPRAPDSVAAPMPEKYIVTYEKKQIPLGEVAHKYSRDAAPRIKAGEEAAERYKTVNRKVTTLNPEWVQAQQPTQPAVKDPASKAPVVGKPAEPAEENWGQQIIGGVREAIGMPREGFGPGIMRGVRSAVGIPSDGLGPGIMRGVQRFTTGLGQPSRPLTQQQISGANANRQNHNAAALAAINEGKSSYNASDGTRQPTVAMNGKVRNTYGD